MEPDMLDTYAFDLAAWGNSDTGLCDLLADYFADCDDRLYTDRNDSCFAVTPKCPKGWSTLFTIFALLQTFPVPLLICKGTGHLILNRGSP